MAFNVLLVLTSQNRLGDSDVAAGSWLEELAAPYFILSEAGCRVDFASIQGGVAPIDPASAEDPWLTDNGRRLLSDTSVMARLESTSALSAINTDHYDALFMVGGAAVMWDFPHDPALGKTLKRFADDGRITAGVCHGVAGFLNPHAGDLLKGHRATCISDQEDNLAGYDKWVPFMPEAPLRESGATLSFAAEPFGVHVVRDGTFITGENPASAGESAKLVLEVLKERGEVESARVA